MRLIVFEIVIFLFSFNIKAQLCLNSATNRNLLYEPYETITADFNLDGKADVAITTSSGIIQVLLGNGNNTFGTALNVSAGSSPSSLTSGDFNADGNPDLAVANYGLNYVSVLLGLGTGSFVAASTYTLSSNVFALNCNDFNGDGNLDMAVTSQTTVSIFSGLGTGLFSTPISYSVGVTANLIKSSDLNSDGKLDLILANKDFNSPYVFVAMGLSTGGFSNVATISVCNSPGAIICNDFNDDGIKDIVVTNSSCGYRSVLIGTGTGSFSSPFLNYCKQGQTAAISADFNNDGKQDIAIANSGNASVNVLLGSGILTNYAIFNSSDYATGMDPQSVACSDFNGDGHLDLIVGNRSAKTLSVLNGSGNGRFAAVGLTTVNPNPMFSTIADLNNDGNSDLVIGYANSSSATILLNDGSGTSWNWYSANLGTTSLNVECADINHDGNMDLIAVNESTNSLTIRPGEGNGLFTSPITYSLSSSPSNIAIGDFNNDSNADLAVTHIAGNISIILGTSTGTLLPAISYSVGGQRKNIVVSDYNNDGNMDLVTNSYNSNSYEVSLGLGNGNFAAKVSYNAPGSYPWQIAYIATKDFNGDGISDLAITQINSSAANLAVFIATGTGSFTNSANYSIGSYPNSVACADYNGDNKTDLAIVATDYDSGGNSTYNNVSFFLGSGSGTFGTAINYPVGYKPIAVENADFNNDGKVDLVSLNFRSDNITVIMNGPPVELTSENPICEGTNATILAYGANTYSWNTGSSANNINVSPTINTTYTVTGIATSGCIGTAVKTISVTAAPSISVTSGTICNGSSFTITPGGADTFTFSSGGNIVNPLSSASYTVLGTNTITTCTGTAISTIYVDQNCQDVWPGDANSDGFANNLDVLELGLHFTQTGAPRASISNDWQSYFANNWTGTITNGKNLNHSDCNGDGTINNDDTLAIYNNYSLSHSFKTAQTTTVNPQLRIVPDQSSVSKGSWGTASIYLGDATTNINNINGVAFTVDFDNALIETNSVYIDYQNSFIDVANQNLDFEKLDFATGKIFTATTHTINSNVSGFGKIATLHYQIKSTLTTDEVLNIILSQANQSDASGLITPLTTGTGTLMAIGASVGLIENLNINLISINPNPTSGLLTVNSKTELQKIEVVTITGQILMSEIPNGNNHLLHLDNFANGIYFVNLFQNNRIIQREKVIVNK